MVKTGQVAGLGAFVIFYQKMCKISWPMVMFIIMLLYAYMAQNADRNTFWLSDFLQLLNYFSPADYLLKPFPSGQGGGPAPAGHQDHDKSPPGHEPAQWRG